MRRAEQQTERVLQNLVAVLECTSRSLLPEKYRKLDRGEILRRGQGAARSRISPRPVCTNAGLSSGLGQGSPSHRPQQQQAGHRHTQPGKALVRRPRPFPSQCGTRGAAP